MTQMLLARHGQSEWNALGRWQGQADVPLSDLGRRQARAAAAAIGTVDVVVASDLERALRTASIISEQIGVGPVIIEPLLRERDAGEWSGLTRAEIDEAWPGYIDGHRRPPGVEPEDTFLERTHAGLRRVHAEFEGAHVLVVTHGGLVYALEREAGLPFARLPNLGAREVVHHGERISLGPRLDLVADEDADDPTPGSSPSGDGRGRGAVGPAAAATEAEWRRDADRAHAGPEADIDPNDDIDPRPDVDLVADADADVEQI
jgi:broad specificity phosphatase PhoE